MNNNSYIKKHLIYILLFFVILFGCSTFNKSAKIYQTNLYNCPQCAFSLKNLFSTFKISHKNFENYIEIYNTKKNISKLLRILDIFKLKMDIISNNIANATTTRTTSGGHFKKQILLILKNGKIKIKKDKSPGRLVYDPSHPDAINKGKKKGYVIFPNISMVNEMTDMIAASRKYETLREVIILFDSTFIIAPVKIKEPVKNNNNNNKILEKIINKYILNSKNSQ